VRIWGVMNHTGDNSSELRIRTIEPRDVEEVLVLVAQLGYERTRADIARWIDSLPRRAESQTAFVACYADKAVGWIEISIEHRLQSPAYALIGGLVVKDGFRNQRIGLRLCERAEQWSWEKGVSVVRVTSRSTRVDAHRFYESNGYSLAKISQVFEKSRPT
jgi:predicted N-acetyltransferase YhbS